MNIAIIAPFCSLPDEPHFNRFFHLAQLLAQKHQVLLITSDFRHYNKTHRTQTPSKQKNLTIKLLHETGYAKNVSIARIKSHRHFTHELANEIHTWQPAQFDLVYSAYPLIGTNLVLAKYKKIKQYPLVIDIQDIWPESFSAVIPAIKKLPTALIPFTRTANQVYQSADALVAVSQTYLNRARQVSQLPPEKCKVTYIGADAKIIQSIDSKKFSDGIKHFFYFGTLSHSYDIATVCQAFEQMAKQKKAVCLHIIGGGNDFQKLQTYASEHIIFHGFLNYLDMMALAKSCDFAINPIHHYAAQSITNKLSDYMLLGKPILNSQIGEETDEVLSLITHENYESGNVDSLIQAADKLIHNPNPFMNHAAIHQRFDRNIAYRELIDWLEHLVLI